MACKVSILVRLKSSKISDILGPPVGWPIIDCELAVNRQPGYRQEGLEKQRSLNIVNYWSPNRRTQNVRIFQTLESDQNRNFARQKREPVFQINLYLIILMYCDDLLVIHKHTKRNCHVSPPKNEVFFEDFENRKILI